jgi:hypothetical protein
MAASPGDKRHCPSVVYYIAASVFQSSGRYAKRIRFLKEAWPPVRKLLRDLWDKEETKIALVLAVALVLSALFFCWDKSDQLIQPGGKLKGEAFRYDYNW